MGRGLRYYGNVTACRKRTAVIIVNCRLQYSGERGRGASCRIEVMSPSAVRYANARSENVAISNSMSWRINSRGVCGRRSGSLAIIRRTSQAAAGCKCGVSLSRFGGRLPMLQDQIRRGAALERQPAGQHLEQHRSQAVNVAADIGRLPGRGTLRGQVVASAHHRAPAAGAGLVTPPRKTQVQQRHVPARRRRTDCRASRRRADNRRHKGIQGLGRLADDPQRRRQVQQLARGQPGFERRPFQPGHDQEMRPAVATRFQHRHHVRMGMLPPTIASRAKIAIARGPFRTPAGAP